MRKRMERELREEEERLQLKLEIFKKQQAQQLEVNKKLREELK